MLLAPLRQKRDYHLELMHDEGVPMRVLENYCQGKYDQVDDYFEDNDQPDGWDGFVAACHALEHSEKAELAAALTR